MTKTLNDLIKEWKQPLLFALGTSVEKYKEGHGNEYVLGVLDAAMRAAAEGVREVSDVGYCDGREEVCIGVP